MYIFPEILVMSIGHRDICPLIYKHVCITYVCMCSVASNSFVSPWTVARQAPLSMEVYRQEHWSGLSFPSSRDLPNPGIKPVSLVSPALAGRFFTTVSPALRIANSMPGLLDRVSKRVFRQPTMQSCFFFQKEASFKWLSGVRKHDFIMLESLEF